MRQFESTILLSSFVFLGLTMSTAEVRGFSLVGVHSETGDIYEISPGNAASTRVATTGVPGLGSLELTPDGLLYGFTTDVGATLYCIDPDDFSTTAIGQLAPALFFFEGSIVFAPSGAVYGTNLGEDLNAQLFSIDILTGQAMAIGTMGSGEHDINGMAWREDGMLVGLDRVTNTLWTIDPSDATMTFIATVDPLVGGVGGMVAVDGMGFFTTSGPGGATPGSNELYSFDLFTGAHTLIGTLSPTITGVGISGLAVPEPASLLLTLLGGLAVIRRRG